ncbi:hypothetical protein LTV02_07620 [Nocardia yamanashiensis]|uniref:hypothetical protein n=1 Tax=Nocardia yamanashiensis TaxID=209247 RepID=UPI001E349CD0|nr:hypothetical protein [Nocardia yamanashiensis]UGT43246.1 hypothetical protein LTV02_07620 [Nocardia yamanashiensis]
MTLQSTDDLITSDRTPEFAIRIPGGEHWLVTWLEDRELSREQAIGAMILDETLSDPATAAAELGLELAAVHAEQLGLDLREAVLRLSLRMLERAPDPSGHPVHVA